MKQEEAAWILVLALLIFAPAARAQTSEQAAVSSNSDQQNIQAYIDLLRGNVRQQKAEMMGSVMQLSAADAAKFWPIYEQYDQELAKLNFELEFFAYGKTSDWGELTAIRQDVILKIAGIVEAAGTGFAAPTRLTYQAKDPGIDADKANDIVRQVTELRANNAFQFPGEVQTTSR